MRCLDLSGLVRLDLIGGQELLETFTALFNILFYFY